MMSRKRKMLVGTIALVLIIGLLAGTGVIMAHEDNAASNGEDPSEEEGTLHCHNEDHEDDHVDEHHEGNHHHEDGSTSGGFFSLIRRLFRGH